MGFVSRILCTFQILVDGNYSITILLGPNQKWKEYDYKFDIIQNNVTSFKRYPIDASFTNNGGSLIIMSSVHKLHRFMKITVQMTGKKKD